MLVSMPFKNNQTSDPPKKLAIKIINISVYGYQYNIMFR